MDNNNKCFGKSSSNNKCTSNDNYCNYTPFIIQP